MISRFKELRNSCPWVEGWAVERVKNPVVQHPDTVERHNHHKNKKCEKADQGLSDRLGQWNQGQTILSKYVFCWVWLTVWTHPWIGSAIHHVMTALFVIPACTYWSWSKHNCRYHPKALKNMDKASEHYYKANEKECLAAHGSGVSTTVLLVVKYKWTNHMP
jgi:hypothetical protein